MESKNNMFFAVVTVKHIVFTFFDATAGMQLSDRFVKLI